MLLVDDFAAGSLEFVELGVCCLLLGRDAGVANQALPSRGGSHVSISEEISALCTYFAITRKGSFENVSQAILLTSCGGEGFSQTCKNGLNPRILAARLPLIGDPVRG
jgi:hypothetical protein